MTPSPRAPLPQNRATGARDSCRQLQRRVATLFALMGSVGPAAALHPLSTALPQAEIRIHLSGVVPGGQATVVETRYSPRREGDVKKERRFHLFDSPWRSGSRDLTSVAREEAHLVHQAVPVVGGVAVFSVPLHDPDAAYRGYQLAAISVAGVKLARWFAQSPQLDPAFGLECTADALRGALRLGAFGAQPLNGALPLWPGLRQVVLQLAPLQMPGLRLWDPLAKNHWDGWRTVPPLAWPGGETVLARHVSSSAVWRGHAYFATLPADAPPIDRAQPPADALPGVTLEVFWPDGDTLEFPEVQFERPVSTLALRLAGLSDRAKSLLEHSVQLRPGAEIGSLTAAEWDELKALGATAKDEPVTLQRNAQGGGPLVLRRRTLDESWLYLFSAEYDARRRRALTALLLHPRRWAGSVPE